MTQIENPNLDRLILGCIKQKAKYQKMLYQMFYGFCLTICLRYAKNRPEAVQIMSRGFLNAFTNIGTYDGASPFKAWLGGIMVNVSIDYYRPSLKLHNYQDTVFIESSAEEEPLDKNLDYHTLLAMIQQLPNDYRIAFNLFAFEGYSYQQMGSILNISPDMSESNLQKARHKLREMIVQANLSTVTDEKKIAG